LLPPGIIPNAFELRWNFPERQVIEMNEDYIGAVLQTVSLPPMFPREYFVINPID